ncbi:MAG TPA: lyase family protein, partial [Longimicrobium sp.]
PRTGFNEINLPAMQPGSSIMPGKVNPVIPEVMNQVAFEVIGNDMTVTMASEAGQLQLNAFEPIMGWSLFKSIEHLGKACLTLKVNCVDGIEATADTGAFVQVSGVLKRVAVKLSKICNDLRLLSSGPRTGFNEINLPAMQPGSSIMPGKVNPVIPEVVNQVCFQVVGNDLTITMAAEAGQLQLNVFEPVIGFNLFQSTDMLTRAAIVLRERCIVGITANRERLRGMVENSIGLVTALVPYIGYERSTAVALEALQTGASVCDLICEKGWVSRVELDDILSPEKMTQPRPMPHPVEGV